MNFKIRTSITEDVYNKLLQFNVENEKLKEQYESLPFYKRLFMKKPYQEWIVGTDGANIIARWTAVQSFLSIIKNQLLKSMWLVRENSLEYLRYEDTKKTNCVLVDKIIQKSDGYFSENAKNADYLVDIQFNDVSHLPVVTLIRRQSYVPVNNELLFSIGGQVYV